MCMAHSEKFYFKISGLAKKNKELYNKILSLPFVTRKEKFEEIVEEVSECDDVSDGQYDYLELKMKTKQLWAKCYAKNAFAGGISTTSRIEGLHGVLKKRLTSGSSLVNVFQSFRSIEKTQIEKFHEEYNKGGKEKYDKTIEALSEIKKHYSVYIYNKIAFNYFKGINYSKANISSRKMYFSIY